jgi:imidazolonepropionase-like amidohydrolase
MRKLPIALVVFCACATAASPPPIAIRNAKIVTISGSTLNRGTVILRNGLIQAVGENAQIPPDAAVIEGEGLTVYPGLIDGLSTWGMPTAAATAGGRGAGAAQATPMPAQTQGQTAARVARGPEDRPQTTSWIKAADEIQPTDRRFDAARGAGFTTAVTFPTRGIFAGQGSVINLNPEGRLAEMVISPAVGQHIALGSGMGMGGGGGYPGSLMGIIAYIRQIYLDADNYTQAKAAYAKEPLGVKRPDYDRALEGVLESKRILLPASSLVEIDRMIRFAAELKQPVLLYGIREGFRPESIALLKKAGAPVLVSMKWPEAPREPDPDEPELFRTLENRTKAPSVPAELKKAGIPFALYSDGIEQARDLQRAVKKAIDAGLAREDAIRALTLSPAEIYGVADRLGSIQQGKIANLVVTRGDLFDDRTRVEMVFVDGVKFTPPAEAAPQGGRGQTGGPGGER